MQRLAAGALVGLLFGACAPCAGAAAPASPPAAASAPSEAAATLRDIRRLAERDAGAAELAAQALQSGPDSRRMSARERVQLLNLLARIDIYRARNDAAQARTQEAAELARRHGDMSGQAEALLLHGIADLNRGRPDPANEAWLRSAALMEQLDDPSLLAEILMRAATSYWRDGRLEPSVELCVRALGQARRSDDAMALTWAHQCMAISYSQSRHDREAIAEFEQMAAQARRAGSVQLEAHALLGIGSAQERRGDIGAAETAMRRALDMFRLSGAIFSENLAVFALANVLGHQPHRREEALEVLNGLVEQYRETHNPLGLWWTYSARSTLLRQMGRRSAAIADERAAEPLAHELGSATYLATSAQQMARIAAEEGRFQEAFERANLALGYMRQTAESHNTAVNELARRYDAQQRDRDIADLKRRSEQQHAELRERALERRWLWTILAATGIALTAAAGFTMHQRRTNRLLAATNERLNRSQQQFQEQAHILRSVLDGIADGVCVCDASGRLLLANPAARNLMGPPPTFAGSNLNVQFFTADSQEPLPRTDWPLSSAVAGRTMTQVELRMHHLLTGQVRWLSVTARPLTEHHGPCHGAVAVFSDITVRRMAEIERQQMLEELTLREREYRTLAENLPDLVARYDSDLKPLYFNPALLLELGQSGPHDPVTSWPYQPSRAEYLRRLQHVIATGVPDEFRLTRNGPAGSRTTFSVRMVAERSEGNRDLSVMAIARDVTAMQIMQDRLAASRDQLRELAARAETAREDERRRIARELHDELGQLLTSLRMRLATLQLCSPDSASTSVWRSMTDLLDRTIAVTRDVVAQLRPAALDSGLVVALEWLIDEFRHHTGIRCQLHTPGQDFGLSDEQATVMFRIVQESLTNVARHAQADHVDIGLDMEGTDIVLTVRDNGRGFDATQPPSRSFGLAGMRERGHMLGGRVAIDSEVGHGTTVQLRMPLHHPTQATTLL